MVMAVPPKLANIVFQRPSYGYGSRTLRDEGISHPVLVLTTGFDPSEEGPSPMAISAGISVPWGPAPFDAKEARSTGAETQKTQGPQWGNMWGKLSAV